jgi:long-chain fatty acid transport protein
VLRGALGLAWCWSVPAAATPVDALGIGARSKAMAGATAALAEDYSANYYNPSQLAMFERLELSLGYTHASFNLESNSEPSALDPVDAWMFGVVAPGSIAGIPVAFGMAAQLPAGYLSRSETIRETDPYWVFYEARMQLLYTSVNLAVMPVDGWSLGVGTASLATTRGGFQVRGTTVAAEFDRSEYESDLEHQIDARLVSTRYPQVATSLALDAAWRFGLSYREEAKLDTVVAASLDTVIDGTIVEIPVRYDVLVRSVKMFIPRQLNLAAAWAPERLRLELDLTWYDWSSYRSPVSSTSTEFDADPPEGVTITLPMAPNVPPPEDPRFRDRLVPRVGAEYTLPLGARFELPLRAGYSYEATPVPPQTGATSFLDSTRHLLSAGAGMKVKGLDPVLAGGLRLDLAFQWGLLEEREQTKLNGDRLSSSGSFWVASADTSLEF